MTMLPAITHAAGRPSERRSGRSVSAPSEISRISSDRPAIALRAPEWMSPPGRNQWNPEGHICPNTLGPATRPASNEPTIGGWPRRRATAPSRWASASNIANCVHRTVAACASRPVCRSVAPSCSVASGAGGGADAGPTPDIQPYRRTEPPQPAKAHWTAMSGPAAYRLGDGAPVTSDAARAISVVVAREVLEESARRTPAGVTRTELPKLVQQRSGVHTRMAIDEWLTAVVAEAAAGDAQLSALCRPDVQAAAPRTTTKPRAPRARAESTAARRREAPVSIC